MLARTGRQPATVTTVSRGPASDEVAEWLGIEPDDEVVIRDCNLRARGGPPVGIATSYFPLWVVEARPNLENAPHERAADLVARGVWGTWTVPPRGWRSSPGRP